MVLCVWCRGVPPRCRRPILFLTAKDRYELVGHGFNLIRIHKPTIQTMMAISDTINAGELTAIMVEEVRTNHLLAAAELLRAIWTGSSYVDCVEFMFG